MVTGLDLSNQRILITGGAGFLGRQVVKHLCEAGADPEKMTIPDPKTLISGYWRTAKRWLRNRIL